VIQQRASEMGLTPASYLAEIGQAARPAAIPPPPTTASPDSEQPAQPHRLVAEHGRRFSVLERRALAAELMGVRRLLSGAATNLNQLAKAANSTGHQQPAQVHAATEAITRYLTRLDTVVTTLDPREEPGS
jgi:Bacterial mobilisation protein (MobC)